MKFSANTPSLESLHKLETEWKTLRENLPEWKDNLAERFLDRRRIKNYGKIQTILFSRRQLRSVIFDRRNFDKFIENNLNVSSVKLLEVNLSQKSEP